MNGIVSLWNSKRKSNRSENYYLFFSALPFCLFILAFSYVPLFGWIYSFFDFKPGIPLKDSPFTGLYFFQLLFTEGGSDISRVMVNTLALSFLGILFSPLPIILAIMLNEVRSSKFKKFIQSTTTLPNFISWIIVYSLAFVMLSSDGVLNSLLISLRLISSPLSILDNEGITWVLQAALSIWKGVGFGSIIYLATIAGIDSELYDAADVDGAGRLGKIIHITLPGISSTYFVLLLLAISSMLSAGGLDQYLVFYNPLVADKIEVLDYYVYRIGIVNFDYSYSTAIGILKTGVSLILLFSANRISKIVRGENII